MADGERDSLIDSIEDQFENEIVKLRIERGNLFNAVYKSNNTLLHYAVEYENVDIVEYLVESGSQINARNDEGQTPLTLALGQNFIYNKAIVRILFDAGADIYLPEDSEENALCLVGKSEWASEEILRLFFEKVGRDLLSNKVRVAQKLIDHRWPLHKFILLRDVELTRLALRLGYSYNVNTTNYVGDTPLHVAVKNVDVEHVTLLLEYMIDVNAVDRRQRTPLSYLYGSNSADHPSERFSILVMLLDERANLTFRNGNNDLGVFDIFRYGSKEVIELLELNLGDLSITDSRGNTVVHVLATNKNPGAVQQLRDTYLDVNVFNENRVTPLMAAVIDCNIRAIDYLTIADADTEAADKDDRTALYIAVEKSQWREDEYRECVQMLLERGANAQVQIYNQRSTILEVLLEHESMIITEIVLAHLAYEEAIGEPITEPIGYRIGEERRFNRYFEQCKCLLTTEIYGSVRLFDLMTESDETVESYAGDREFMLHFKDFINESCNSYYFVSVLEKRLWKPIYISALTNEAARFICRIMNIEYDSYPHVIDKIVSYFEPQDIEQFLDTSFKKSNYSNFSYTDVQSYWKL